MSLLPISNAATFKAIALEAHKNMCQYFVAGRKPKDNGSDGWTLSYDPKRKSFEQALIVIVFTAMWLSAIIHILIVRYSGVHEFVRLDRKMSLEKGLRMIGYTDEIVLNAVKQLQKCRKALIHEKAYLDDGGINIAQEEADNAYRIIMAIEKHLLTRCQPTTK